tara:strand:- start:143 stop:622 length:480 start_codon:yes stop_codon:yes gene_type:complete
MKKLLLIILLNLFISLPSLANPDGKGIDCKMASVDSGREFKVMYWFNNSKVANVFLSSYDDEGMPDIENSTHLAMPYTEDADKITWRNRIEYKYYLDRKTLELKSFLVADHIKMYQGSCKVFIGFAEVKKRHKELLELKMQRRLEKKERDRKAREGNKI